MMKRNCLRKVKYDPHPPTMSIFSGTQLQKGK